MNYDEISKKILINVGGKGNIDSYTSCITRLRITVKDINKISTEIDKDITKKKSKISFGKGTIIINSIETNSATTIKSFENIFFIFIY